MAKGENGTPQVMISAEELLGAPRAAEVVGVSVPTIKAYAVGGKVPFLVIDGRMFFRRCDLEALRATHPPPLPRQRMARAFELAGELVEVKTAPATERQRKQLPGSRVEVKADETGAFVALVYLCNGMPDLDGDLIAPSAFHAGDDVVVSQWNHSSMGNELPAGRGTLKIDGNRVLVLGQFNLDSTPGRDTYETVKQLGDRCEWSIGYLVKEAQYPSADQEDAGVGRVISELEVFEVSPVVKGAAGAGRSGTLDIKAADLAAHNAKMIEERAQYVQHEIPRRYVPDRHRIAAERARKLAGHILSRGVPCQLPTIRYFDEALAKSLNVAGTVWTSHRDEIWVYEGLDEARMVECVSHECLHTCDKDMRESDVKRFGLLVETIDRTNADVVLGEPESTPITTDELTFLVTKDWRLFKSLQLVDDEYAPRRTKVWPVATGRLIHYTDDHGHALPSGAEVLRLVWDEVTLLV